MANVEQHDISYREASMPHPSPSTFLWQIRVGGDDEEKAWFIGLLADNALLTNYPD